MLSFQFNVYHPKPCPFSIKFVALFVHNPFQSFCIRPFYAESTSLAYSPVMPNGVAFVDDPPLRSVDDGLIDKLLRSMLDVDGLIDKLLRSTDDVELLLLIDKLFRRERRRHRSCNSLPSSSLAFKFSYMVQVS